MPGHAFLDRVGSEVQPAPCWCREAAMDIAQWLRALGLEQYASAFEQNHIRPELLPSLTADDLKDIGIASVGHRRQLLEAIAGLQPATAPGSEARRAVQPDPERRQEQGVFRAPGGPAALALRPGPRGRSHPLGPGAKW